MINMSLILSQKDHKNFENLVHFYEILSELNHDNTYVNFQRLVNIPIAFILEWVTLAPAD